MPNNIFSLACVSRHKVVSSFASYTQKLLRPLICKLDVRFFACFTVVAALVLKWGPPSHNFFSVASKAGHNVVFRHRSQTQKVVPLGVRGLPVGCNGLPCQSLPESKKVMADKDGVLSAERKLLIANRTREFLVGKRALLRKKKVKSVKEEGLLNVHHLRAFDIALNGVLAPLSKFRVACRVGALKATERRYWVKIEEGTPLTSTAHGRKRRACVEDV